jgi:hypothetical protein
MNITTEYTFTDVIKRPMDVAENTSDKTLFISRASQMDREMAKDFFNFFHRTFIVNYMGFGISAIENISNQFFRAAEKAQLLCTTHNTQFLNLKKFRKDQIFFANKKPDGSTDLYSLYNYSDFSDTMDLEKAYLQGRFDALLLLTDSYEQLKHLVHEPLD